MPSSRATTPAVAAYDELMRSKQISNNNGDTKNIANAIKKDKERIDNFLRWVVYVKFMCVSIGVLWIA